MTNSKTIKIKKEITKKKSKVITNTEKSPSRVHRALMGILSTILYPIAFFAIQIVFGFGLALIYVIFNLKALDGLSSDAIGDKINALFDKPYILLIMAIFEFFAVFLAVLIAAKARKLSFKQKIKEIGFVKPNINIWWLIPAGVVGIYIALIALSIIFNVDNESQQEVVKQIDQSHGIDILFSFLAAAFIIPIAEEVWFRGLMFQSIKRHWNEIAGIITVSLIFGLIHYESSAKFAVVFATLVSVANFIALKKSKSIYTSIGIHMIINFIATLAVTLN